METRTDFPAAFKNSEEWAEKREKSGMHRHFSAWTTK